MYKIYLITYEELGLKQPDPQDNKDFINSASELPLKFKYQNGGKKSLVP